MKDKLLSLSLLALITSCYVQGDYLPIKSQFYETENKSVIFEDSDFTLNISGRCSRPDIYNLSSEFNIEILTRNDSLTIDFRDVKFVADDYKFFNKYFVNGPDGDSKFTYNLLPDQAYNFSIKGMLFDSLLVEFNDNLNEVSLIMNGIAKSGSILTIPVFLFKSDSTVFNIKN